MKTKEKIIRVDSRMHFLAKLMALQKKMSLSQYVNLLISEAAKEDYKTENIASR